MIPGLKPTGKCRYYKSVPKKIDDSYLCAGDEYHEPCADFETCRKKQKEKEKDDQEKEKQGS